MVPARSALPAHVRLLLESLVEPQRCRGLDDRRWDLLIRAARSARLLGVLATRIASTGPIDAIDEPVRRQLTAALVEPRFQRIKALYLIATVEKLMRPLGVTPILLKGAAYIVQKLPLSEGRLLSDVDLMVPRSELDRVERQLTHAGWTFRKTDAYDQHYYRAWSHELPPMTCAGQALDLDLHHAILPPTGRLHPDAARLIGSAVAVADCPFRVLAPADQVLHAAAHLFQDSDCIGRLRDLVDFDGLMRCFGSRDPRFDERLLEHARAHQLGRPLYYAVQLSRAWLDTPVAAALDQGLEDHLKPNRVARRLVISGAALVLPPPDPDAGRGARERIAGALMRLRAMWLRMPPWLLAYHSLRKAVRQFLIWRGSRNPRTA